MGSVSPKIDYSDYGSSRDIYRGTTRTVVSSSINSFRNMLTDYLDVCAKIETTTADLNRLNEEKRTLETKIATNPEYEKFSDLFVSIGRSRK